MMAGITLLYMPSLEIMGFIRDNPIDWDEKHRAYAQRNGHGDRAGMTPTPAVEEFLLCLKAKQALFTQAEYLDWCRNAWGEWRSGLSLEQGLGVKAKLYRNFYPSMIDSLHVWAMLVESKDFDYCVLDSTQDAIGKTDLTVRSNREVFRLALLGPTRQASDDRKYKIGHRATDKDTCIEIQLSRRAPKSPGNKRWFTKADVLGAIKFGRDHEAHLHRLPTSSKDGQLVLFLQAKGV